MIKIGPYPMGMCSPECRCKECFQKVLKYKKEERKIYKNRRKNGKRF